MKAALLKSWNNLELTDVEKPMPGAKEALLRVEYGGVCGSDITVYRGQHPTAIAPVVLCHEILGIVEELPADYIGDITLGDLVLVNPVIECGECAACKAGHTHVCSNLKLLGIHVNGGFAEYTKANVDRLVKVSPTLTKEVAALGEPFAVAYHVTERGGVKKGDKVLVIGAGTIGLVVALTARERGAEKVVISEINPNRLALAKKLEFDTMNPMEVDMIASMKKITEDVGFDVVIDASGSKSGVSMLPELCRIRGIIMSLGLSGLPYEFPIGKVSFKEITLVGSRLYSHEHFVAGVDMLVKLADKYCVNELVTDIMPLSQVVEGIEKMKAGESLGKILIKCRED